MITLSAIEARAPQKLLAMNISHTRRSALVRWKFYFCQPRAP